MVIRPNTYTHTSTYTVKRMKIIKYSDILENKNIDYIKNFLEKDNIIIYPTDTIYGIGGNFFSLSALKKIDKIKERIDNPYSVVISDISMLNGLVEEIPDIFYSIYKNFLPGKFTFLFNASKSLNKSLLKNNKKIGIRIPDIPNILKLIKILNFPLISTSVNRSGEKPLNDPEKIMREFPILQTAPFDFLLIDYGIMPESKGSTIIDISKSPIKYIRKGDDYARFKSWMCKQATSIS